MLLGDLETQTGARAYRISNENMMTYFLSPGATRYAAAGAKRSVPARAFERLRDQR